MAVQEVQIPGTSEVAKIRSPVNVALLSLVTLGIYGIVWYYKINKEMAELGKATGKTAELGDNPATSVLAVTVGSLALGIPAIISIVHTFKRVQAAQRLNKVEPLNGWLGLLLAIAFSPAMYAYMQSGLNPVWQAQLGAGPATPAVEAPAVS